VAGADRFVGPEAVGDVLLENELLGLDAGAAELDPDV
jgi:hypothetical protein